MITYNIIKVQEEHFNGMRSANYGLHDLAGF